MLLKAIVQLGIFMICTQAVIFFRPNASYEKYLRWLVSAMLLLQIFLPVIRLFSGQLGDMEEKILEFQKQFQESLEQTQEMAEWTDKTLEEMSLEEIRRRLEADELQESQGTRDNVAEESRETGKNTAEETQKTWENAAEETQETGGTATKEIQKTWGNVAEETQETEGNAAEETQKTWENTAGKSQETKESNPKESQEYIENAAEDSGLEGIVIHIDPVDRIRIGTNGKGEEDVKDQEGLD